MLTCKFHFIFYFYPPLKSLNFNYNNMLLLTSNSLGIRHCNHQRCSRTNLLKLTNYIKAKCLCEVICFLYSNAHLNHSVHSPNFCWGIEPSTKFSKTGGWGGGLIGSQLLVGDADKKSEVTFSEDSSFYIKK